MTTQPTHCCARFATKAAAIAAIPEECKRIIVQFGKHFLTYASAEDFDADAAAFAGQTNVREIVVRDRLRRAFVDVDSKETPISELKESFANTFDVGIESVMVLPTTRGYHLVGNKAISVVQHVDGLQRMSKLVAGVDIVVDSLRLATTLKIKNGVASQKTLPANTRLSASLVQPWEMPLCGEGIQLANAVRSDDAPPDSFIRAASVSLCGRPDMFTFRERTAHGECILLDRVAASGCNICGREHDSDGAFAYIFPSGGMAYCQRDNEKKGLWIKHGGTPPEPGPGLRNSITPEFPYCEAPVHLGGSGCIAPSDGDYMDASPCGLGKSEAAWASIMKGLSVLIISYRRAFTAKTTADHKLESYENIKGPINMGPGRRVIVQADSAWRIEGVPDVIILDEWHGINRQLNGQMSSPKNKKSMDALLALIGNCGRLIALDADIDDRDAEILEIARGTRPVMYRNVYKPHTDKTLYRHTSHATLAKRLNSHVEQWSSSNEEYRRNNRLVVFCHAKSKGAYSVEGIAKMLASKGMRIKAYTSGTDQKQKALDFSDVDKAFENVDAVIYNSSVEAGISIVNPAFKDMFVFSGRLGSVEVLKQAMHRFRCITDYHYAGSSSGVTFRGPQTEAGWVNWLEAKRRGKMPNHVTSADSTNYSTGPVIDEDLKSFRGLCWLAVQLDQCRSASNYDERLMELLSETGFKICTASEEPIQDIPNVVVKLEPQALPRELAEKESQRIGTADVLSAENYPSQEELESGDMDNYTPDARAKDLDEMASAERIRLARVYKVSPGSVSPDFVELYGKADQQYYQFQRLISGRISAEAEFKGATPAEKLRKIEWLTAKLGFGKLADENKRVVLAMGIKIDPETAKHVSEMLRDWNRLYPHLRKSRAQKIDRCSVMKMLATLVEPYGLALTNSNKANPSRGKYSLAFKEWPIPYCVGEMTYQESPSRIATQKDLRDWIRGPKPQKCEDVYDTELSDADVEDLLQSCF